MNNLDNLKENEDVLKNMTTSILEPTVENIKKNYSNLLDEKLDKKVGDINNKLIKLQNTVKSNYDEKFEKNDNAHDHIKNLLNELKESSASKEDVSAAKDKVIENLSYTGQKISEVSNEISSLNLSDRFQGIHEKFGEVLGEIQKVATKDDFTKLNTAVDTLQKSLANLKNEVSSKTSEIKSVVEKIDYDESFAQNNKAHKDIKDFLNELKESSVNKNDLSTANEKVKEILKSAEQRISEISDNINSLDLRDDFTKLNTAIDNLQSSLIKLNEDQIRNLRKMDEQCSRHTSLKISLMISFSINIIMFFILAFFRSNIP